MFHRFNIPISVIHTEMQYKQPNIVLSYFLFIHMHVNLNLPCFIYLIPSAETCEQDPSSHSSNFHFTESAMKTTPLII